MMRWWSTLVIWRASSRDRRSTASVRTCRGSCPASSTRRSSGSASRRRPRRPAWRAAAGEQSPSSTSSSSQRAVRPAVASCDGVGEQLGRRAHRVGLGGARRWLGQRGQLGSVVSNAPASTDCGERCSASVVPHRARRRGWPRVTTCAVLACRPRVIPTYSASHRSCRWRRCGRCRPSGPGRRARWRRSRARRARDVAAGSVDRLAGRCR